MKEEVLLRVALRAGYPGKVILEDVRFELTRGEVLALVGSSGAGKTTLVLSLLGLLPWRGGQLTGEVLLDGQNLVGQSERKLRNLRGCKIALVPQSPMTALNPALSLQAHFDAAWKAHNKEGRLALAARVEELMAQVQLPSEAEFLRRRPAQISVGQAQRVLIALALLHCPEVIIADEPTSALDPVTQTQIVDLFKSLNRLQGTTILYISHDLVSVLKLCDRIAVLDAGKIVETLPVAALGEARHPATMALLNTLPAPADVLVAYRDDIAAPKPEEEAGCGELVQRVGLADCTGREGQLR